MANLLTTTIDGILFKENAAATVSGTTLSVDMSSGNFFEADLANASGDIATFNITNMPATGKVGSFTLKIKQGLTNRSIKWGSLTGVEPVWKNNMYPNLQLVDYEKNHIVFLKTYDAGTTWYGEIIGAYEREQNPELLFGTRGVFAGGWVDGTAPNNDADKIEYITISSAGNATDFGNLTVGRRGPGGTSNGSRGVFSGGWLGHPTNTYLDIIDYITIATTGNGTDFGDLTVDKSSCCATSDGTKAIVAGGIVPSGGAGIATNNIDYLTITTAANSTDFGDLTVARSNPAAVSDGIIGVITGKNTSPENVVIDKVTISTAVNATDYGGVLTVGRDSLGSAYSRSRGLFMGGHGTSNVRSEVIDYITIPTSDNALDFGNLTIGRSASNGGTGNGTRAVFAGGYGPTGSPVDQNVIDYVTIATLGNATDFGDLSEVRTGLTATSGD